MIPINKPIHHFNKHNEEMGATSPDDYLQRANQLLQDKAILFGIPGKRNTVKFLHPITGEALIYDPEERKILTYYIRKSFLRGNDDSDLGINISQLRNRLNEEPNSLLQNAINRAKVTAQRSEPERRILDPAGVNQR